MAQQTTHKRGFAMDFLIAGVATSGANVVSNPMEVVKTRMQLQGELAKTAVAGNAVPSVRYRNFAHGFYTICRTEGLVGIQRGLLPGMAYQVRGTELCVWRSGGSRTRTMTGRLSADCAVL